MTSKEFKRARELVSDLQDKVSDLDYVIDELETRVNELLMCEEDSKILDLLEARRYTKIMWQEEKQLWEVGDNCGAVSSGRMLREVLGKL